MPPELTPELTPDLPPKLPPKLPASAPRGSSSAILVAIIRRDVLRFVRDRNGAISSIVLPIVLGALLGTLFAPRSARTALLVVEGSAPTETAKSFLKTLSETSALKVETVTLAEAELAVGRGDSSAALLLPGAGDDAPMKLLVDPSKQGELGLVEGVIKGLWYEHKITALTTGVDRPAYEAGLGTVFRLAGVDDASRAAAIVFDLAGQMLVSPVDPAAAPPGSNAPKPVLSGLGSPFDRVEVAGPPGGRADYDTYAHNFAGMLCMFLLFFGIEQAKERIADRALGLDNRIDMSPSSAVTVRIGKWLATVCLATVIGVLVFSVAIGLFGVRVQGSWAGFLLVLLGQAVFISSFSVALSDRCTSPRQAASFGTFFSLVASFLGGAWMPSFLLPDWVQPIAQVLPTHWATKGFAAATWRGLDFAAAAGPAAALVLLGLGVSLAGGGLKRRHR